MDYRPNNTRLSLFTFALFALLTMFLLWKMTQAFLSAFVFAGILAGTFYPLLEMLEKKLKINRTLSSLLICLLVTFLIIIPFIILIFQVSGQTLHLYHRIREAIEDQTVQSFFFGDGTVSIFIRNLLDFFNVPLEMTDLKTQLTDHLSAISANVLTFINGQVGNLASFFFQFIVMIVIMFAIFKEGSALKKFIYGLLPIPQAQSDLIVEKFNQMNFVTLTCNGLSGLIQGILAATGFYLAGLHSFFLWASLTVFMAFIPIIGMTIVYVPVCLFLAIKGSHLAAVLLFIYCLIINLATDNWFKPRFIGHRIKMNSLFILFCIVGGIKAFGMAGIFYGPIIGILFLTMTDIYQEYYRSPQE